MAASSRAQYNRIEEYRRRSYGSTYTEGSAVRHVEAVPQRVASAEYKRRQQEAVERQYRRERAMRVNATYVLFMVMICACLIGVSVRYLQLQAAGTAYRNTIAYKESQLNELKLSNDNAYEQVMAQIDMKEVKSIALNELGMKYAEEGQIITYNSQKGDYIRQYGEITTE